MSGKYGTGRDGQYCYADSGVLINKLGITEEDALDAAEIELTQARINQYEPDFDASRVQMKLKGLSPAQYRTQPLAA